MYRAFPTLSTFLGEAGYCTGVVGKIDVMPEAADAFDFRWSEHSYNSFSHRDVRKVAEVAGEFMKGTKEPFFLSVNFPDAHLPFLAQEYGIPGTPFTSDDVRTPEFVGIDTARLRAQAANYYNCIRRLDTGIGILLKQLAGAGLADNTLVLYLSDHGANFSRGKFTCYEGGVRIPLIIRWPGYNEEG